MKVREEEQRVEKMTKARSLLNQAKSLGSYYSDKDVAVALLYRSAFNIFNENSNDKKGENAFDQDYFNGMLAGLQKVNLNARGRQAKLFRFPDRINVAEDEENLRSLRIRGMARLPGEDKFYIGRENGSIDIITKGKSRRDIEIDEMNKTAIALPEGNGTISMAFYENKGEVALTGTNKSIVIADFKLDSIIKIINDSSLIERGKKSVHYSPSGDLILHQNTSVLKWDNSHKLLSLTLGDQFKWSWNSKKNKWDKSNPLNVNEALIIHDESTLRLPKYETQNDETLVTLDLSANISDGSSMEKSYEKINSIAISINSDIVIGTETGVILVSGNQETIALEYPQMERIQSVEFSPSGDEILAGNRFGELFSLVLSRNKAGKLTRIDVEELPIVHSSNISSILFDPTYSPETNVSFLSIDRGGNMIKWLKKDGIWNVIQMDVGKIDKSMERNRAFGAEFTQDGDYVVAYYSDDKHTTLKWPASMEVLSGLLCDRISNYVEAKEQSIDSIETELTNYGLDEEGDSKYYCCSCGN